VTDASGGTAARVLAFELNALRILGHAPQLEECVECGSPVEIAGRVPFALLAGGVLCPECRPGKRNVVALSAAAAQALARFAGPEATGEERETAKLDERITGELRGVMNQYFTNLLGRPLRMPRYLTTR